MSNVCDDCGFDACICEPDDCRDCESSQHHTGSRDCPLQKRCMPGCINPHFDHIYDECFDMAMCEAQGVG